MTSKEERDKYAVELVQRFDDFTKWAIANWPNKEFHLLPSDFSESRKEISKILGPKLSEGESDGAASEKTSEPYINMNPMPWP
jgi:hypothetical protein